MFKVEMTLDGYITRVNAKSLLYSSYSENQIIGSHYTKLLRVRSTLKLKILLSKIHDCQTPAHIILLHYDKNGNDIKVEWCVRYSPPLIKLYGIVAR